jgi:hypothetical protein
MVTSTSRLAYSDCFDLLDKAVADQKGIKIKFASYEDAFHFRLRLHQARKIDRKDNRELYNEGHPMHGRSVYDVLTAKIKKFDNGAWLRIERLDTREFEIESLTEGPEQSELRLDAPIGPPVKIEISPPKIRRRM